MSGATRALNPSPRDNLLLHPGALGYGGDTGEEDRCTDLQGDQEYKQACKGLGNT